MSISPGVIVVPATRVSAIMLMRRGSLAAAVEIESSGPSVPPIAPRCRARQANAKDCARDIPYRPFGCSHRWLAIVIDAHVVAVRRRRTVEGSSLQRVDHRLNRSTVLRRRGRGTGGARFDDEMDVGAIGNHAPLPGPNGFYIRNAGLGSRELRRSIRSAQEKRKQK